MDGGDTRVVVNGVFGRMGTAVCKALDGTDGFILVGGVFRGTEKATQSYEKKGVLFGDELGSIAKETKADVIVDFTNQSGLYTCVDVASKLKIGLVSGSTGYTAEDLVELKKRLSCDAVGAVIAPNFSVGALVLKSLSKKAASFFNYADIYETHHEKKLDTPSGTAIEIAKAVVEGSNSKFYYEEPKTKTLEGAEGARYEGVSIHSARLPGTVAEHTITFGAEGQTLSLSHKTINRDCFMSGVLMAVKHVIKSNKPVFKMEEVLGL